jgi:hypothetical protein
MDKKLFEHRTLRRMVTAVSALGAVVLGTVAAPSLADHGFPHLEVLARGTFLDDVGMTVRSKVDGRATHVVQLDDSSDIMVLRITIEPGGVAPWHDHTGTGFLVNLGPGTVTNYLGEDCTPRFFYPNEAFVDPGHGELHAVRNDSDQEVVLIATFFGVEGGPVVPAPEPTNCYVL